MSEDDVEHIFQETRFPKEKWKLLFLIFYVPVGLILATIRTFICLHVFVASIVLGSCPEIRRFVLRSMCVVLGIVYKENSHGKINKSAKVFICNHVTPLDYIPIHISTDALNIVVSNLPDVVLNGIGLKGIQIDAANSRSRTMINAITSFITERDYPVLLFPEEAITNGKTLLQFSPWISETADTIQPIAITASSPLLNICGSSFGYKSVWHYFIMFFSPYTLFTVTYLPVQIREENETKEAIVVKLQNIIADHLGITVSPYTSHDLVNYEKRELLKPSVERTTISANDLRSAEIARNHRLELMKEQVLAVLPSTPENVILHQLRINNNVDLTIANILDGKITNTTPVDNNSNVKTHSSGPNTSATETKNQSPAKYKFPSTSQERMCDFKERKEKFIAEARRSYMEKHNLKLD